MTASDLNCIHKIARMKSMALCAFYHNFKTKLKSISGPGEEAGYQSQCKGHHETFFLMYLFPFIISQPCHGKGACVIQGSYEPGHPGWTRVYLLGCVVLVAAHGIFIPSCRIFRFGSLALTNRFSCSVACKILVP